MMPINHSEKIITIVTVICILIPKFSFYYYWGSNFCFILRLMENGKGYK